MSYYLIGGKYHMEHRDVENDADTMVIVDQPDNIHSKIISHKYTRTKIVDSVTGTEAFVYVIEGLSANEISSLLVDGFSQILAPMPSSKLQ